LGEEQFQRYKKVLEENKKLKQEVRKLRKILDHSNIGYKMDPAKKKMRELAEEKDAIENLEMCPECKAELKPLRIPRMNKTLHLCTKCKYRITTSDSSQSE